MSFVMASFTETSTVFGQGKTAGCREAYLVPAKWHRRIINIVCTAAQPLELIVNTWRFRQAYIRPATRCARHDRICAGRQTWVIIKPTHTEYALSKPQVRGSQQLTQTVPARRPRETVLTTSMSFAHRPEAKPNWLWFARRITCQARGAISPGHLPCPSSRH